jgi:hypothetical protein
MDAFYYISSHNFLNTIAELYLPFVTAAFFKFVLFAAFEMRYFLDVSRAHRRDRDDAAIGIMYSRFCELILPLYFIVSKLYEGMYLVVGVFFFIQFGGFSRILITSFGFILYSFWVPQIIKYIFYNDLD